MDSVERLKAMLARAGVTEEAMKAGVRLTPGGLQKAAAALGIGASEVPALLKTLASTLRRDDTARPVTEAGDRFTHERDYLGNVTIRDTRSGREVFVRGSEATDLLKQLDAGGDRQAILARFAPLMEGLAEAEADPEEDFSREIGQNWGSYNFPWSLDGKHGTGTARYSGEGHAMRITLVHVRDNKGAEIHPTPATKARLTDLARDFIGRE